MPVDPQEQLEAAAARLINEAQFRPLMEWWESQVSNATWPPGPVDPMRLAMAQGDRERLRAIRALAYSYNVRAKLAER